MVLYMSFGFDIQGVVTDTELSEYVQVLCCVQLALFVYTYTKHMAAFLKRFTASYLNRP